VTRHHGVPEENAGSWETVEKLDRLVGIFGAVHDVTLCLEQRAKTALKFGMVFHDENGDRHTADDRNCLRLPPPVDGPAGTVDACRNRRIRSKITTRRGFGDPIAPSMSSFEPKPEPLLADTRNFVSEWAGRRRRALGPHDAQNGGNLRPSIEPSSLTVRRRSIAVMRNLGM
jgi:hypothetical protein